MFALHHLAVTEFFQFRMVEYVEDGSNKMRRESLEVCCTILSIHLTRGFRKNYGRTQPWYLAYR